MNASEKAEMTRLQVISKIRWGSDDEEVREWLEREHGIAGVHADQMLAEAHQARSSAIRGRALIRLVFSILGLALTAYFFYVRYGQHVIFLGTGAIYATVLAAGIGGLSVRTLLTNVRPFLTGTTVGPVDPA